MVREAGRVLVDNKQLAAYMRPHYGFDPFEYLGECASLGETTKENGELNPKHCIDSASGAQYVSGTTRSAPGLASTEVVMKERLKQYIADELETCSHDFDRHSACSALDDVNGWEELLRVCNGVVTTPVHGGFDVTADGDELMVTLPISAIGYHKIYPIVVTVTNTTSDVAVEWQDVVGAQDAVCGHDCGPAEWQKFYALSDLGGEAAAQLATIEFDRNGIATIGYTVLTEWAVSGGNALYARGDYIFMISTAEAIQMLRSSDAGVTRVSITGHATWAANAPTAIWGRKTGTIFVGQENGYISVTYDQGATWQSVFDGAGGTLGDIRKIRFAPDNPLIVYAVGDSNTFLKSENGGASWYALTGPSAADALLALAVYDSFDIRVGNDDGELWESVDGGVTLTEVTGVLDAAATSQIVGIEHCGCRVSALAMKTTTVTSFSLSTEQYLYRNVKEWTNWYLPTNGELAVPGATNFPLALACLDNGNIVVVVGGAANEGFIAIAQK